MNTKPLSIIAASGLLIAATTLGYAQSPTQENAPGQRMQDSRPMPGATGQQTQEKGSKSGQSGASGFAPGRQSPDTTGRGGAGQGSMGDRDPDRDRGDAR
jgi:hypothetical protein